MIDEDESRCASYCWLCVIQQSQNRIGISVEIDDQQTAESCTDYFLTQFHRTEALRW